MCNIYWKSQDFTNVFKIIKTRKKKLRRNITGSAVMKDRNCRVDYIYFKNYKRAN